MHVRVRIFGKPDTIVVVDSKLAKIEEFRRVISNKFDVDVKLQRLFYGGKLLEDGYTFHDYNIKLNDVIQLMVRIHNEDSSTNKKTEKEVNERNDKETKKEDLKIVYKEATSEYYAVGDFIDMKDREQGAWFEGKVVQIVQDPDQDSISFSDNTNVSKCSQLNSEKECDLENKPPSDPVIDQNPYKTKQKGIAKYFIKPSNSKKKPLQLESSEDAQPSVIEVLYKVQLDADEEDSNIYCKLKEIRPRARSVVEINDLNPGDKVMVNHNTENSSEKGYWYDFTVNEVKKLRTSYELVGTLYLGPDAVPQNDTRIKIHDKVFAIEEVIPLSQRSEEYKKYISTPPEKRALPMNCLSCRDDEDAPCKECGCYLCSGKENPEKIVLCDECNKGYHMHCLSPPLTDLPEDDWYCPSCKRDPNDVIAPGAAKQTKKTSASKSNRDWGRGMACVGKTKTSAMPANHFGPIPGIEVGMCWRFRIQLSESGIHRPPVSGIHGRDVEGAYSIVLSGGYEDDVDHGNEFTYTGSGGRDLSGNKRTAEQSCDQTLTRENKALARNCAVKQISETGGDAGDNWRSGKPVRVVRSYKMMKHFPKYAPKEGIRYDGIYKVVKYYPEKGLSGYRVWKYMLRRDDPSPAPWEPGVKQYPIVYPDGYLEAEAEKKAQKLKTGKSTNVSNKKRALRESNQSSESDENSTPPGKKRKTSRDESQPKKRGRILKKNSTTECPNPKMASIFSTKSPKVENPATDDVESAISSKVREAIKADTLNLKLWEDCLQVCKNGGKTVFVEHVAQVFLCIICQEVAASPVTTPCLHNFCMSCLKLAFKSTGSQICPCCRQNLSKYEPQQNDELKTALQSIMAGYDAGKK